eukprot:scaffold123835_cov57-Phaeocystis_antarctica.AAC.4
MVISMGTVLDAEDKQRALLAISTFLRGSVGERCRGGRPLDAPHGTAAEHSPRVAGGRSAP